MGLIILKKIFCHFDRREKSPHSASVACGTQATCSKSSGGSCSNPPQFIGSNLSIIIKKCII
ncbi:MAG TPA: hypothetical protein PK772_08830, partial [Chitinophagaceae bacterium]|nr:hypothetical protein [Chitinophagaceae bacterium]